MDASIRNMATMYFIENTVSICLAIGIIVCIGFLSQSFLGELMIGLTEKFINHVPFFHRIYQTVKPVIRTFRASRDPALSKTLLMEFPKEGSYVIGFLSSQFEGEISDKIGRPVVNVFVATTGQRHQWLSNNDPTKKYH
jgi:uncharacterized membrane protein